MSFTIFQKKKIHKLNLENEGARKWAHSSYPTIRKFPIQKGQTQ